MRSYNDHAQSDSPSSQSDLSDHEDAQQKTTQYKKYKDHTNPQHADLQYSNSKQDSDQQEEDSLDASQEEKGSSEEEDQQEFEVNSRLRGKPVSTIKEKGSEESSEEEDSDNSIDHIEQRIKKLEKDLENRIDRHKQETNANSKVEITKNRPVTAKTVNSPPLPNKKYQSKASILKIENQAKTATENKMAIANQPVSNQNSRAQVIGNKSQVHKRQENKALKEVAKQSPKKKVKAKKQHEEQMQLKHAEKKRKQSKNNLYNEHPMASKQIEQLQRTVEELKTENKRLREQFLNPLQKRKKPVEELEKLKELSAANQDVKLDKQIQLLKIIQSLQNKLKKSIHKKLLKHSKNKNVALLHKGLPATLLN